MSIALLPLLLIIPALIALAHRFDGLYGQDPFAYYDYSVGPLRSSLHQLSPPPLFAWPPGYPLLVALASFVVGARPLAGQLVSVLAGAAVPLFTALLAREAWATGHGDEAGDMSPGLRGAGPLVAGLLMACCGQLWQSSVVVMSDTTGLAAATAGVWALVRYSRTRRGGWLLLAAALLAWAILTRWAYALVALPCTVYACWLLARAAGGERHRALWHGIAAAAFACAIVGPTVVAALAGLRATSGPYASFAADLQVYRWHPLNALRREFATADGQLTYLWPNGLYYATLLARPFYFTPLLGWLVLPGLWRALRRPNAPLLLLVGWLIAIVGFHAGAPWQNVRFGLACAPPCAILIALGLDALWDRAERPLRLAARGSLVVGLACMVGGGLQLLDNFIDRQEDDLAVARAIAAPPASRLLSFGLTLTLRHYAPYETHDLSEFDPTTLATMLADGRPTLLLLDVPNIERQWHDRAPGTNYRWLQAHPPGLTPIARHRPYTLFRVGEPTAPSPNPQSNLP